MRSLLLILVGALVVSFLAVRAVAQEATPPAAEADWQNDLVRTKVFEGGFKAGAHVRYHGKRADHYARVDTRWRWSAIVLGALAFFGPFIFNYARGKYSKWVKTGWYVLGFVALLASIAATFNKSADRYQDHAVLEKRWAALDADWERLLRQRDDIPRDELRTRVDQLATEERAIESAEPSGEAGPDLARAWDEEAKARNLTVPPPPPPASG